MEIIDHNQLAECLTGESDVDLELMQTAIDEIDKRIATMRISLEMGDDDAWRADAHRSVGVAATLGFRALADECRTAEHHAHSDAEQTSSLERIIQLIELTRQELKHRGLI